MTMRKFIAARPFRGPGRQPVWHYAEPTPAGHYVAACGLRTAGVGVRAFDVLVQDFEGHPHPGEVCQRCARLLHVPNGEVARPYSMDGRDGELAPFSCNVHGRVRWGDVMTTKCCRLCLEHDGQAHELLNRLCCEG